MEENEKNRIDDTNAFVKRTEPQTEQTDKPEKKKGGLRKTGKVIAAIIAVFIALLLCGTVVSAVQPKHSTGTISDLGGGGGSSSYTSSSSSSGFFGLGKDYSSSSSNDTSNITSDTDSSTESSSESDASGISNIENDENRKLIYNSQFDAESTKIDETTTALKQLVDDNGGYVKKYNDSATTGKHIASYALAIPVDNYSTFIQSLRDMDMNIIYANEQLVDATDEYQSKEEHIEELNQEIADLKGQLNNATDEQTRKNLQAKIDQKEDDIDDYEYDIKAIDKKSSYCSVSVDITEVFEYTETVKTDTFADNIANAFNGSIENSIAIAQLLLVIIIYIIPFVILAVIISLIYIAYLKKFNPEKYATMKQNKKESKDSEL